MSVKQTYIEEALELRKTGGDPAAILGAIGRALKDNANTAELTCLSAAASGDQLPKLLEFAKANRATEPYNEILAALKTRVFGEQGEEARKARDEGTRAFEEALKATTVPTT